MTIRNRYSDPAIGQAFENIAGLFAPMSAQDLAGYATADANRQKAMAQAQQTGFLDMYVETGNERAGAAGGAFTPNQSMEAVRLGDATTRRGQDVSADTSRYTADQTLRGTVLANIGKPNAEGESSMIPDEILEWAGIPGASYNVSGGQKPRTYDEVRGQLLQDAASDDDEFARWVVGGSKDPIAVVGPTGPVMATPDRASGMGVYERPSSEAVKTENYALPNGQTGTAVYDAQVGWKDTQTGAVLPQGAVTGKLQAADAAGFDVTGGVQTTFNNERARIERTVSTADQLLTLMDQAEPKGGVFNVGARGLDWVQNARQSVREITASLPDNATADDIVMWSDNMARTLGADHDPTVRQAVNLYTDLVYMMAQRSNPRGEIGRYQLQQAMDTWGLSDFLTGNDAKVRGLVANMLDLTAGDWEVNENRLRRDIDFGPQSIQNVRSRVGSAPAAQAAAPSATTLSAFPSPPPGAADALRADPALADQFDAKYGPGAAASILGN